MRNDVLAEFRRAIEDDHLSFALRVLNHRYRVGAWRNARARHDLDALARAHSACESSACA